MDFADRPRQRPTLNVAPLIDVVFLLLVFFMLASTFIETQAIDLVMPSSNQAQGTPGDPLVVNVDAAGEINLNGLRLAIGQLRDEIAGRIGGDPSRAVTVRAERAVPVQLLVQVMDHINAAGTKNIKLATPDARAGGSTN